MSTPSSETSHPAEGEEEEEEEENAAQSCTTEALKKRARTFSYSVLVPLWSLLVAIFVQHHLLLNSADKGKPAGEHLENALLQTCVLSIVVTGGFTVAFLLVAEFLPDDNYDPSRYHYLALKLLLHACGFLLKLTAFCLLLLIDAAGNAAMASVVLLAAALHVVLYNKTRRSTYHNDAAGYAPYTEELDRLIDFSKEMVNVAYGGLIGRVFDYFKNFTTDVRRAHLKVFDVLMFFTAVIAALALTLDALPPLLREERDRKRLVRALEWLNIVSALTAVVAALALSFGAVGEYAFLTVVPPLAVAVWWLKMYFANEGQCRDGETGARGARPGMARPCQSPSPSWVSGYYSL
uniref:Uncharacterized protein n=1 Tax=Ananas comosus var. bracteatus TaxID=296719 RepID=A0A6V7PVG3_ANACO|nr:unnamed protein product [Ananas comosus var. bracteatus]